MSERRENANLQKSLYNMKFTKFVFIIIFAVLSVSAGTSVAFAQQPEEPDYFEFAENEADRLQRVLGLEDWQVFYVDSTLKHDYPAMVEEYKSLQASKVANTSLYQSVNDKWMEKIDMTFKKIFTEQQWALYLKQGAGKNIKAREKRKTTKQK